MDAIILKKSYFPFLSILIPFLALVSINLLQLVKPQEITSVVWIGDKDFRYVNFANYSNGDMVVETTANPVNSKRMFYGLKQNGDYFFSKNGRLTPFYTLNAEKTEKSESVIFSTKVSENNKEYLVSISTNNEYCELYDFERNTFSEVRASDFLDIEITSLGSANTLVIDGNTYIIYAFWSNKSLKIYKLYFSSTDINNAGTSGLYTKSYSNKDIGNHISCFETQVTNILTCLILYKKSAVNSQFDLIALDTNMAELGTGSFTSSGFYPDSFYKCVSLKFNVGAFLYYAKSDNLIFPYISLYYYTSDNKKVTEYCSDIQINYNNIQFNMDWSLNDVIRVSNSRVCFITTTQNKEILYIALIEISNNNKNVIFRYYQINLYSSYNYKILSDIKGHLFNNMASLAFSFCQNSNCNVDENNIHYSGLLIFSYPNSTDVYINLRTKKNIDIKNITIDLQKNVKIENNIFGLIYSSIEITEMINCDNVLLNSTTDGSKIITNYKLDEGENIQLQFIGNNFYDINCTLKYRYIITEPNQNIYDSYPVQKVISSGSDSEYNFKSQIHKYKGKTSIYNIYLGSETIEEQTNEKDKEEEVEKNEEKEKEEETSVENTREEKEEENREELKSQEEEKKIEEEESNKKEERKEENNEEEEDKIEDERIKKEEEDNIEDERIKKEEEDNFEDERIKKEEENNFEDERINKEEENNFEDERINKEENKNEDQITEKYETNKTEETNIIKTEGLKGKKTCSNDDILNGKCADGIMENDQVSELYESLIDDILKGNYEGENKVIETENVIIQLSTLEDQKNSLNPNISNIDLVECEDILKKENNITKEQSLILLKTDIKNEDLSSTVVQYEIYHPVTKDKLNLESCKDVKIVVNVPVKLDSNKVSLYDSLSESGYNLFDSEDSFYNDICATYTSENGTDMLLEDRKKEIFSKNGNISLCQDGCKFESYNKTTQKAKCNCDAQSESTETDLEKINFDKKKVGKSFLTTLTNSNFFVLKCYKLALNFNNFIKNKGRIIMTLFLISFVILIFVHIFVDNKRISKYINSIISNKKINQENNSPEMKEKETGNINFRKIKTTSKKRTKTRKRLKKPKIKEKNILIVGSSEPPNKKKSKRKRKKKLSMQNEKVNSNNYVYSNQNLSLTSKMDNKKAKKENNLNINIIPISNVNYSKTIKKYKLPSKNGIIIYNDSRIKTQIKSSEIINNSNLNDEELNSLEYEQALIYDKRNYFEYYWSLLKKKQLILFTFLPSNDYNLLSLKLSLFLISFSLYFTVNGFFLVMIQCIKSMKVMDPTAFFIKFHKFCILLLFQR